MSVLMSILNENDYAAEEQALTCMQGLGLGLPASEIICRPSPARKIRMASDTTVTARKLTRTKSVAGEILFGQTSLNGAKLRETSATYSINTLSFPLPPFAVSRYEDEPSSSELDSSEQSYWSPSTIADSSVASSPSQSYNSSPLLPQDLSAHPALHLLSPKGEAIASTFYANSRDEVLEEAISFGWIVSRDTSPSRQQPNISPSSLSSTLSHSSLSSGASSEMLRAPSLMSSASNASMSTAATSLRSDDCLPTSPEYSVLSRNRPIVKKQSAYFGGSSRQAFLRRPASKTDLRNAKSCTLLSAVAPNSEPQELSSLPMIRPMRNAVSMADLKRNKPLPTPPSRLVKKTSYTQEPRHDLLQLWQEVEDRSSQTKPAPKVVTWLKVKNTKSMPLLTSERKDNKSLAVKEPKINKAKSI